MKKIEKNKRKAKKEVHKEQKITQAQMKEKLDSKWEELMHSPQQKKLSAGAEAIFEIKRTRNHWGNKQLWGYKDKGRHKPGHATPKVKKKK